MAFDSHSNFGYSTVAVAPVPALTGLTLTVAAGQGALFPTAPFNATVWPALASPLAANAEIIRVTAKVGDVLTIVRAQEGSAARSIVVGDQIANTTSVKVFTDIENAMIQGISAAGGVATASQVVFSNSNGVSFGVNAQTVTASHDGITSQSNQAFSAQGGSSTFQTLSFQNANGVTFSNNAGAVEASYTVPSTAGLISAINLSAGTTSNNLTAATFSNANGVSFGLAGSVVTASVAAGAAPGSISAGTTSVALGQVVFSNSNNVTFGLDGSTVTASFSAAGAAGSAISFEPFPAVSTASEAISDFEIQIVSLLLPQPMSVRFARILVSMSRVASNIATIASASATAEGGSVGTFNLMLFTKGIGASSDSLMLITSNSVGLTYRNSISITNSTQASYTQAFTFPITGDTSLFSTQYSLSTSVYSFSTNAFVGFSGNKYMDIPVSASLSAGNYWLGVMYSASSSSAGAVTALRNPVVFPTSRMVCNQIDAGGLIMGNSATGPMNMGGGQFTATTTTSSIHLTNITRNGSNRRLYLQFIA